MFSAAIANEMSVGDELVGGGADVEVLLNRG